LFANRSGRVANRFDCARQLIFGHVKMPRPIFNMILTLDNDFAAVRGDFTDHLFVGLAIQEGNRVASVSFRLTERCSNRASGYGLQSPQARGSAPRGRGKEAANRRATEAQVLEDAERLIAAWNERQAKRMPMLFSPTIGAAITAGYWFLWVRCPACRTTNAIDLRTLDRHRDAAVTSLIPVLSCRSCRPTAPFAELVRLSRTSIADEMRIEHTRSVFND